MTLGSATAGPEGNTVKRALQAIRSHLGMEVAYVSEFVGDRAVMREVDAPGLETLIKPGDSNSLDDVYCRHILEGRLPGLMPDTAAVPLAASMPITRAVPVGSHMSVPIRLPDGSTYGMFCCLGLTANQSLNERDLNMMKAFAELAAFDINREVDAKRAKDAKLTRIKSALDDENISIVYQPIWRVAENRPIGLECLARFNSEPRRTPDLWFNEAAEVGLGVELELAAIELALCALSETLPDDLYLAVNASPATVMSPGFAGLLASYPAERIVLEITEHAYVPDYDALLDALKAPRARGVRLAVDDAGAGYSSLQHILHLQPDIIKLDMALTRNTDLDPARRALASALIQFARDTGCRIIAEGVETASELKTLKTLGVEKAQGYYLGRPMPLEGALRLLANASAKKTRVA
ncbi:MAG: EAL domain-containing protein [Pseudolabrys sp.]|nr:EAL domain-containing protein [Pseudolabrys sp.]